MRDLDLITFLFFYHDTTYMPVDRAEMNRKLFAALKPGGMLVIADHSAKSGDGTSVGKSLHRIEESALRREVEAVGFKLVAEGDFWRHPEDARDFSIQPPSGKAVDEFVLKFQKPMSAAASVRKKRSLLRRHHLPLGGLHFAFCSTSGIVRLVSCSGLSKGVALADGNNQLPQVSLSTLDYPACNLAVCPVWLEPS